jgi:hypothetical protein
MTDDALDSARSKVHVADIADRLLFLGLFRHLAIGNDLWVSLSALECRRSATIDSNGEEIVDLICPIKVDSIPRSIATKTIRSIVC